MNIVLKDGLVHKANLFTIAIHFPWSFVDFWTWDNARSPSNVPTSGPLTTTMVPSECSAVSWARLDLVTV
jgi:hypothetical protein